MPVIKSAKKKLRQDKKRTVENKKVKDLLKKTVKELIKVKDAKTLTQAFSIIDKATKKNLIHKNKAARLKSSLSKKVSPKPIKENSTTAKTIKKEEIKKPSKTKKTSKK